MATGPSAPVTKDIVDQVKARGHFDTFRRECLTSLEDEVTFKILQQKVNDYVETFLANQRWHPQVNKSQMREQLRQELTKAHFLQSGVRNVVDHIVSSRRLQKQLYPVVEALIYEHFGLENPSTVKAQPQPTENQNSDSKNDSTPQKDTAEDVQTPVQAVETPVQDECYEKGVETKLEQIDVDEGAELFVQCQITQISPVPDKTQLDDDDDEKSAVEIEWDISSQTVKADECETKLELEPVTSPASVAMSIESDD